LSLEEKLGIIVALHTQGGRTGDEEIKHHQEEKVAQVQNGA
jgi:hypothetical protein